MSGCRKVQCKYRPVTIIIAFNPWLSLMMMFILDGCWCKSTHNHNTHQVRSVAMGAWCSLGERSKSLNVALFQKSDIWRFSACNFVAWFTSRVLILPVDRLNKSSALSPCIMLRWLPDLILKQIWIKSDSLQVTWELSWKW